MKIIIAFIALTVLALVGSRRTFETRSLPLGAQLVWLTGTEFLLVGLLLGRDFLNVIDATALAGLRPFVTVALGWIGFLFGLQFERRALAGLPQGLLGGALVQGVVTLGVVLGSMWMFLGFREWGGASPLIGAAVLAASAACTGQSMLALVDRHLKPARRRVSSALRVVASIDPVVGVMGLGVALTLFHLDPMVSGPVPEWARSLGLALCFGCLTAWIFVSLTLTRCSQAELVLYLLGTLALASGIAIYLHLSALFVTFVCGLVVANMAQVRTIRLRTMELMVRGEKFLYLLLLVLAGALWRVPTKIAVVMTAVYVIARLAGKLTGGLVVRRLKRDIQLPGLFGLGLASQAGMGVAILVDYALGRDGLLAETVISVGLLGIIINEFLAPRLVMRVAGTGTET